MSDTEKAENATGSTRSKTPKPPGAAGAQPRPDGDDIDRPQLRRLGPMARQTRQLGANPGDTDPVAETAFAPDAAPPRSASQAGTRRPIRRNAAMT
jgi:hypothetical protein